MTTVQAAGRGRWTGQGGLARGEGLGMGNGLAAEVAFLPGDLSPLSPSSPLVSQSSFTKPRQSLSLFCFTRGLQKDQVLGVTGQTE